MASFQGLCSHQSMPVEMDESMTSSCLDLAWPECERCSHADNANASARDMAKVYSQGPSMRPGLGSETLDSIYPLVTPPPISLPSLSGTEDYIRHPQRPQRLDVHRVSERPLVDDLCEGFSALFPPEQRNTPSMEEQQSLELPCSLRSVVREIPVQFPGNPRQCRLPTNPHKVMCPVYCPCQNPVNPAWNKQHFPLPHAPEYRPSPPRPPVAMTKPQVTTPGREEMSEVYVPLSRPIAGHTPLQEVRRTISLPDDCRTVFITYSVDTAKEILPFVKFLIHHGFRPAIDIFENAVQQMDVNKWMDGYLKDKSVLIIMVISPRYKIDVEGDGSDQHGLHTKYIYTQMQNEFIQQRCLNFRLVPVLFPNANQSHVPMWLQSTRLFHWPQDAQDLLLRLLREEKFIPPPLGKELTLTIRPL